ncbi:MAG: hypothetical protein INR70_21315 [Parafilimonas terrae]|nr:hypothetical protein [Parafilimonas terrae]
MTTGEAKPATSPDDLLKAALTGQDASSKMETATVSAAEAAPLAQKPIDFKPIELKASERKAEVTADAKSPSKAAQATKAPTALAAALRLSAEVRKAEPRLVAVAGAALVLGSILGAGAMSLAGSRDAAPNAAIASLATAIDAGRTDTAKLAGSVAKLEHTIAELRTASEAARKETKGSVIGEKLAQLDKSLTAKIAGLGERLDQAEREQTNRLSALATRASAKAETKAETKAEPKSVPKAEPTQTGSLAEPRDKLPEARTAEPKQAEAKVEAKVAAAKAPVLENYALRDIYEGAAIIEGRNRRLFQVMPGDTLPGAGRVEGIERQGRNWVVVTRQGLVTPQAW